MPLLLANVLFILRQLAFSDVRQSVVLVVLREVESHLFAVLRHTHGDEAVDELVARPTHGEGIDEHDDDGQQVIEEHHSTEISPMAINDCNIVDITFFAPTMPP